jgi:hypothetical protein
MVDSIQNFQKIIKTFLVVGLNETKLNKYEDESGKVQYVQNMDIVKKAKENYTEKSDEKWYF